MSYVEQIDLLQNFLIDCIIKLQQMKKYVNVTQVKNPFVTISKKEAKHIENFLRGKATKYTFCGPQVWRDQELETTLSCVFPWVYNDGFEGFEELNDTIYYFKKADLPDEITMEYLIKDCR